MNRLLPLGAAVVSTLFIVFAGSAQELPLLISTERPTIGNSRDLIPGGSVQFENGVGLSFQRNHYVWDLPETLVRLGLSNRAEIRLLLSDEVCQKSTTPHGASFQSQDPAVSIKVGLGRANESVPRSAILSLTLPRGGQTWTLGSYDPGFTGIWTQTIANRYFLNEVAATTLTLLRGHAAHAGCPVLRADGLYRRPSWALVSTRQPFCRAETQTMSPTVVSPLSKVD